MGNYRLLYLIEDKALLAEMSRDLVRPILRHARSGKLLLGVCGGYQMLGQALRDPLGVESAAGETAGLGLLDMTVTFEAEKRTLQAQGTVTDGLPWLREMAGARIPGYEIHSGVSAFGPDARFWLAPGGACSPGGDEQVQDLGGLNQCRSCLLTRPLAGVSAPAQLCRARLWTVAWGVHHPSG